MLVPGEVFAPRRGSGHHVGEADLVLGGQRFVVHVVEQLLREARQEQALPCEGSQREPRHDLRHTFMLVVHF